MSGKTGIEWTDRTWNPVVGCTKVSQGCKLCYAKTIHDMRHKAHLEGKAVAPQYAHPFETVQLMPDRLRWPLSLRAPSRIFVNSVSDLFHEDVPDSFIMQVFEVMAEAKRHTFQILTKRPRRMLRWFTHYLAEACSGERPAEVWPLPNVWLGVSVENQDAADERIPLLLHTPASVRFLSCEPLLGPVNLTDILGDIGVGLHSYDALAGRNYHYDDGGQWTPSSRIDWVIVGGESGSSKQNPRPMDPHWARSIRDQCVATGVPFLFKQWGDWLTFLGNNGLLGNDCARVDGIFYPSTRVQLIGAERADGYRVRAGKKRAGRELDGRTWDEYPAVRALQRVEPEAGGNA